MSFVSGLNWNKCFSAFTLSKVTLWQRWGTMPLQIWEQTLDGTLSRVRLLTWPRIWGQELLRLFVVESVCQSAHRRELKQTAPLGLTSDQTFSIIHWFRWNCKIKLDGVADNSVKWIFVSICVFLNIPPTHKILHLHTWLICPVSSALLFSHFVFLLTFSSRWQPGVD